MIDKLEVCTVIPFKLVATNKRARKEGGLVRQSTWEGSDIVFTIGAIGGLCVAVRNKS